MYIIQHYSMLKRMKNMFQMDLTGNIYSDGLKHWGMMVHGEYRKYSQTLFVCTKSLLHTRSSLCLR